MGDETGDYKADWRAVFKATMGVRERRIWGLIKDKLSGRASWIWWPVSSRRTEKLRHGPPVEVTQLFG